VNPEEGRGGGGAEQGRDTGCESTESLIAEVNHGAVAPDVAGKTFQSSPPTFIIHAKGYSRSICTQGSPEYVGMISDG